MYGGPDLIKRPGRAGSAYLITPEGGIIVFAASPEPNKPYTPNIGRGQCDLRHPPSSPAHWNLSVQRI